MKRRVLEQLNVVLDENGEPRACGRENCKKAIHLAETLRPGVYFGNAETGYMNIESLFDLKKELEKELEG